MAGPTLLTPLQSYSPIANELFVREWYTLFVNMQQLLGAAIQNGPTAMRPTSSVPGRYIGLPFFDTTLGFEIWLKSTNPDVWVRYDGVAV